MTERHKLIGVELAHKILDLVESKPELTVFEQSLVDDRYKAILEYGDRAVITEKQLKILNDIFKKIDLKSRIKKIKAV